MNLVPPALTDEQAMWRVQHHEDHAAFGLLVRRWQLPLRRLAHRMLADSHRAEDIAQETFSRIFARRREFRPDGRFATWMWRIAVNLCHDELRRRQRRPETSLEQMGELAPGDPETGPRTAANPGLATESSTPAEHAALADTAVRVRQALQELPELYRLVVVLRHYEGLKFSEIAAVLEIPEGTVKSRMVEGLARLARRLGPVLADRAAYAGSSAPPFRSERAAPNKSFDALSPVSLHPFSSCP